MLDVYQKLEKIISKEFISNDLYVRHAYSRNVNPVLKGVPDIVIRPKDAQEISEILKIANEENLPVIPRGGGCCEWGGSIPDGDTGILLDMKRMNNIMNLDQDNLIVTVEAGISWGSLNEYLSQFGLYTGSLGPGSGLTASIGGGISHHSVGAGGCAKYGACTNQLVSLEVVLPTGDIIETGSQANKFSKFPFNRFGNGPDLAGLFCGDNGIYGVKTQVSLKVFPRPPFAAYKSYILSRKDVEVASQIMIDIRRKGIDVYDTIFIPQVIVATGTPLGLFPMWEHLKRKRGILFYTIEANSEIELAEKVKQLDNIFLSKKTEVIGPEISDGNFAKWQYENPWHLYHNLWGIVPASEPFTAECFTPINMLPDLFKDTEAWETENREDMNQISEITGNVIITSGSGPIALVDGNNVEYTVGFNTSRSYHDGKKYEIIDELNLKLWKSLLIRMFKHGVQYYMFGTLPSSLMVEIGAYSVEYYNLLKSIKKTVDPNFILSRGKFNLKGEGIHD
ncbi:MAG: FAD-binding oxidoreductase [Promethearchaeota archaeon]